ncbi:MAG: hypothetical protein VX761_08810 [Planctomycetota bacterium]|nr:hypothetical protein [Planctomycetota bacterium]
MNRVFSALIVMSFSIVLGSLQLVAQEGSSFHRAQVQVRRAAVYTSPTTDQTICDELPVGTVVDIYMETSDGYVAIRPTPRCFSWVESRFLLIDSDGVQGTITTAGVPSWIGQPEQSERSHLRMVQLDRGEVVQILGFREMALSSNGRKLQLTRIAPPRGEFRWMLKRNLQLQGDAETLVDLTSTSPLEANSIPAQFNRVQPVQYEQSVGEPTDTAGQVSNRFVPRWLNPARSRGAQSSQRFNVQPASFTLLDNTSDTTTVALPRDLSALENYLSQMVARKTSEWELGPIRNQVLQMLNTAPVQQRSQWENLMGRIQQFQDIYQQRLRLTKTSLGTVPRRLMNINGDVLPLRTSDIARDLVDPSTQGKLTTEAQRTPYEETGYLMEVHSSRQGAPKYALVDEQGDVKVFVTPVPGLNLAHYLTKHIGVFGRRGYLYRLKTQHVTITRVVDLARHTTSDE